MLANSRVRAQPRGNRSRFSVFILQCSVVLLCLFSNAAVHSTSLNLSRENVSIILRILRQSNDFVLQQAYLTSIVEEYFTRLANQFMICSNCINLFVHCSHWFYLIFFLHRVCSHRQFIFQEWITGTQRRRMVF